MNKLWMAFSVVIVMAAAGAEAAASQFSRADKNKDGSISPAEYTAFRAAASKQYWMKTKGLTSEQFAAKSAEFKRNYADSFAHLDKNKDGLLATSEFNYKFRITSYRKGKH